MTTLVLTSALSLLADAAAATPKPRLQGGWEFVWASYGITWAALSFYAVLLFLRRVPQGPPGAAGTPGKGS